MNVRKQWFTDFVLWTVAKQKLRCLLFTQFGAPDFRKPYIMVSGDDAGNAFVVTAATEDAQDWSYVSTTVNIFFFN